MLVENFWYFFNFFWPALAILVLFIGAFAVFALVWKIAQFARSALAAIKDAISMRKPRIQWPTMIDNN